MTATRKREGATAWAEREADQADRQDRINHAWDRRMAAAERYDRAIEAADAALHEMEIEREQLIKDGGALVGSYSLAAAPHGVVAMERHLHFRTDAQRYAEWAASPDGIAHMRFLAGRDQHGAGGIR